MVNSHSILGYPGLVSWAVSNSVPDGCVTWTQKWRGLCGKDHLTGGEIFCYRGSQLEKGSFAEGDAGLQSITLTSLSSPHLVVDTVCP